jgi:predicted metalloprotease
MCHYVTKNGDWKMRWRDGRRSDNVEDQRAFGVKQGAIGGGIGILLILAIGLLTGADPSSILNAIVTESGSLDSTPVVLTAAENESADFVSVVLADTEDTWQAIFQQHGQVYRQPKLVLFKGSVESACGFAQAAMGPFYCPGDQKVYIDLAFYDELKNQLGAPGDFAQAYVIAHEVGHHVQNLDGTLGQVNSLIRQSDQVTGNKYNVMLELQADCYAGVWANHADKQRHIIEAGDIEEAMNAAAKIGDDALQKQSQGYVVPDSFTHGTSAQRMKWFNAGFVSGDINSCDTFNEAVV